MAEIHDTIATETPFAVGDGNQNGTDAMTLTATTSTATTSTATTSDTATSGSAPASDASTPVTLSDAAARRVAKILSNEAQGTALRLSVEGGGCSGFQYKYELVQEREPDDLVLEKSGAVVLIDPISLQYLAGSEIDFVDDIIGQSFQINNPNASAGCGCGTSFAI